MEAYETMYILRPDVNEDALDKNITRYQTLLQENGVENLETQHRGKRRLAYEIQRYREGIYIQMNFEGPGAVIAKMERDMRLSEDVIRYLTVKQKAPEVEESDTDE